MNQSWTFVLFIIQQKRIDICTTGVIFSLPLRHSAWEQCMMGHIGSVRDHQVLFTMHCGILRVHCISGRARLHEVNPPAEHSCMLGTRSGDGFMSARGRGFWGRGLYIHTYLFWNQVKWFLLEGKKSLLCVDFYWDKIPERSVASLSSTAVMWPDRTSQRRGVMSAEKWSSSSSAVGPRAPPPSSPGPELVYGC